jgi:MoaA/NifB/PqqE/SkfB family radical SAM enzyme
VELGYSLDTDMFVEPDQIVGTAHFFGPPYTVCFEVSRRCNFRCNVCISDSSPEQERGGDWVHQAVRHVSAAFGPQRLVWSGGEPTLMLELPGLMEKSRDAGNVNVLVTNASRYLPSLAVDWIDISIYGEDQSSYETFAHTAQFNKVRTNIRRYIEKYPRVSVSFLLGVHGPARLIRMTELALDLGVKRFKFHRLSLAGRRLVSMDGTTHEAEMAVANELLRTRTDVFATYSRSESSDQKRRGYWVAKAPGVLTNSAQSVALDNRDQLRSVVVADRSANRALFA